MATGHAGTLRIAKLNDKDAHKYKRNASVLRCMERLAEKCHAKRLAP